MRKLLLLVGMAACMAHAWGQTSFDSMKKYARTVSSADLKAHIEFLADDLLEGRETGTRGIDLAALYLKTQFQRLGLQPGEASTGSFYQNYHLNQTEVEDVHMQAGRKTWRYAQDFVSFSVASIPEKLDGTFVFAKPDQINKLDLQDKIVLVPAQNRFSQSGRRELGDALKAKGAKAAFVFTQDRIFKAISRFAGRNSLSLAEKKGDSRFPMFYLSPAMSAEFDKLVKKAKGKKETDAGVIRLDARRLNFAYSAKLNTKGIPARNVLGYLEGTDKKDEVIVLTAHYDHEGINARGDIYNGADDDGSGTAAIVELAEAFAKAAEGGLRPRRSLLFMAVSGEEKGLLGSAYYTDNPVYPLANTVANLNIDMIGRTDPHYEQRPDSVKYVYIIGSDRLSTDLHEISELMNDSYSGLTLDYKYNDPNDPNRFYQRSDHYNFAKKGVPIIFYFTGVHKDYHKPTDTAEKINYSKTASITQLIFATTWELANREQRIRIDKEIE